MVYTLDMLIRHTRAWMILAILLAALGPCVWGDPGRKQILILQSYNERYAWARSIGQGMADGLEGANWEIWYDYLDAKNLAPDFDFTAYDGLIGRKYAGKRFDLVVAVDDPAYAYFTQKRASIFGRAPALSLGLNSDPGIYQPDTSYILERPDFGRTINLALGLFPEAGVVHVVVDRSVTGRSIRASMESAHLDRPVRFDWIDSGSAEDLAVRAGAIPPGEVLAFAVYFDPSAGYVSNDRILDRIKAAAKVPIFVFWDFNMRPGILGGYLYDGYELGRQGASIAVDMVLRGGAPVIRDDSSPSRWVFDWEQLGRFGLPAASIPTGARFLNGPQDFWEINRAAVIVFLAGFLVLGGFTVLILLNLRTQRTLIKYGENMIATQREIMHNLGNVIENRSGETASHVQRITRLSLLMSDLLDLPPESRLQLEVCASMHDIGKVGIPDAILKKPGILSPEEAEVMRTHTQIGHSIFWSSPNPLVQAASRIALEHHERWDGGGYPHGKSGNGIYLLARIITVVDVFDALLTERVYKPAWSPARVQEYIADEAGKIFDPHLAKLFLAHWDDFLALWRRAEASAGETMAYGSRNISTS